MDFVVCLGILEASLRDSVIHVGLSLVDKLEIHCVNFVVRISPLGMAICANRPSYRGYLLNARVTVYTDSAFGFISNLVSVWFQLKPRYTPELRLPFYCHCFP
jgi:hypothetical protein